MELLTFERLPEAVTLLFEKIENIEKLLTERSSQPQQQIEQWFDIDALCNYVPDKPVKPTVYGWVHHKLIPCHRRGKKLYFLKSEIDAWLKTGRKKTVAEIEAVSKDYVTHKRK